MNGLSGTSKGKRPRIVIVGAGFAGLTAAQALRGAAADVLLIDRHNHHLFQPLLYQVATASLSPADIAQPIRSIVKDQSNASVLLAEVAGIDKAAKCVALAGGRAIGYDYLVVATGARHSYFGHEDWAEHAPGIKTLDDATNVRANILLAFERAEIETNAYKRAALLTFVVIGGGPTGVELTGAIAELARNSITMDFRSISPRVARIILVEAGSRLLASMPEALSRDAEKSLRALGVEIRLGQAVTDIKAGAITLGNETIRAETIVWAAGVMGSAAGEWLQVPHDRAGRVTVNSDFSVPGHDEIFVAGDTAAYRQSNGRPLPGVAPAAKQAGAYIGALIKARLEAKPSPASFAYRDFGNLATIGRSKAIADFGPVRFKGLFAWVLWSIAHIYFLIGFRNRLSVAVSWIWSYLTYQRGARLITGRDCQNSALLRRMPQC
jgi:NADH dehydrogenase